MKVEILQTGRKLLDIVMQTTGQQQLEIYIQLLIIAIIPVKIKIQ